MSNLAFVEGEGKAVHSPNPCQAYLPFKGGVGTLGPCSFSHVATQHTTKHIGPPAYKCSLKLWHASTCTYIRSRGRNLTGTASKSRRYVTPIAPLPNPDPTRSSTFADALMSEALSGLWARRHREKHRETSRAGWSPLTAPAAVSTASHPLKTTNYCIPRLAPICLLRARRPFGAGRKALTGRHV